MLINGAAMIWVRSLLFLLGMALFTPIYAVIAMLTFPLPPMQRSAGLTMRTARSTSTATMAP